MFDVDQFKSINDTGGHAAGDEVLATLARVLMRAMRANEQVFRIGGDEFAAVVAGATEAGVRAGERILRAARLQRRGRSLPTLSGGVAHSTGAEQKEELLARADAALYAAKDAGGDRILASSVLVPNERRAVVQAETAGGTARTPRSPLAPHPARRRRPRPARPAANDVRDHRHRGRGGAQRRRGPGQHRREPA